jgi:hypothetical protein
MGGKIHVVNINTDDASSNSNYYYIGRSKGGNPLGNPFTFNGKRTSLAKLSFKTREEAIDAYRMYFHNAYGQPGFEALTKSFDEIYEHYKNGEDVYLGCFCKPLPCHGDVIAEELQRKLIKERMKQRKGGN